MALAPRTVQNIPDLLRRKATTVLHPASMTPEPTNRCVRLGLCALLESRHIEVCAQAKNGEEAVEKARQSSPDLIILDITMPVLGGVEAAQQIRVFLPNVPILFFSMHNTPQVIAIVK